MIGNAERFDEGGRLTDWLRNEFFSQLVKNLVDWP